MDLEIRYFNGEQLTDKELLLIAVGTESLKTREDIFRKFIGNGSSISILFTVVVLSSSTAIKTAAARDILKMDDTELNKIPDYRFVSLTKDPFPWDVKDKTFKILRSRFKNTESFERAYSRITYPFFLDLRRRVG